MRYAIIENGVVTNVAESDAEFAAAQGWVACPDEVGIGWAFDGVNTSPPPERPTPEPLPAATKEQLMAELAALTAKIQNLE
jgi:hypothetical protein